MFLVNRRLKFLYLFGDILALILAASLSMLTRFNFEYSTISLVWYLFSFLGLIFVDIIIMYFNGLYDLKYWEYMTQVPQLVQSFINTMFIFLIWSFFIRNISYSRLTFAFFSVYSIVLLIASRYIVHRLIINEFKKGIGIKNVLCVGYDSTINDIVQYIQQHIELGLKIIGYIDDKSSSQNISKIRLGTLDDFKCVLNDYKVDIVLAANIERSFKKKIISYCEENYKQIFMVPDIIDTISSPVAVTMLSATPLINFRESKLTPFESKLKRLLDFTFALIGIVILLPVFILIYLLVKLTSKGPAIFRHNRLGMNGNIIKVYKFRTMVINAEEVLEKLFKENPEIEKEYRKDYKLKNDPRITKLGNFLRKTSLDELPQLFSILRGDMSIVGPRPIQVKEIENYKENSKFLLKTPPGLTGLWQISGRNDIDYEERVKLDMYYINNWSIWLDIMIILKTIPAVLRKKGAY